MAQYDLYPGLGEGVSYLVEVQAEILEALATRVVVPLRPTESINLVRDLTPVLDVEGSGHAFMAQQLASIPRSLLRRKVGSVSNYRDDIRRALDTLLVGF